MPGYGECDYGEEEYGGPLFLMARFAGPQTLGTVAATLFTSCGRSVIDEIHVSNPSAAPVDLTVSVGADAAAGRLFDGLAIGADTERSFRFMLPLENGEVMEAFAGTDAVLNITIDGHTV